MSPWLKTRLLALCCSALIIGGATYLHAQESYGPPAKTPEEAATNVRKLLDFASRPIMTTRYQVSNERLLQFSGSIVHTQFQALTGAGSGEASDKLILLLASQISSPSFDSKVESSNSNQSVVSVAPNNTTKGREIVVVKEDGGYRVDLVATYGRWNKLSGLDIDKRLYRETGWVSPNLASQGEFVGEATRAQCQSNLKQIGLAIAMYTQDYDEKLPPARRWNSVLSPYIRGRQLFTCPALTLNRNGYAYNSRLSQLPLRRIMSPSQTLATYETSNADSNVFAPFTGRAYRHTMYGAGVGMNIGFTDGHVKWYKRGAEQGLWILPTEPKQ